ncbi:MAG: CoB--CoM heterodisulfide reductase iron-sulfur subunit B family protein [Deltaproteobacteria bacterium]|nr:CoB--CoM heterodisulfide reductase iron-sulfur subunit B family protein [Deltaproteobacteria bacterium]
MSTETKKFGYYPGCELRTRATGLDTSAQSACRELGITLAELKEWTCCGGLVPQVKDNYMGFLAPARILLEAKSQGFDELVTLCAFCFNTLRRTSFFLQGHPEVGKRVATFLGVEELPETRVLHLFEVLRDYVGFDRLREAVRNPLQGLRVGPYYGCLLLRPAREINLDNPEEPTLMESLLEILGCEVVDFSSKTDCCGSYHIVTNGEVAGRCAELILHSAAESNANVLVASCPVCQYNLDWKQSQSRNTNVPVVYFTQLLALALGQPVQNLGFTEQVRSALSAAGSVG